MKAILQREYGAASALRLGTMEPPKPRRGEVLVQVHAAGIDAGTLHLMTGHPYMVRLATGLGRPRQPVPGRDLAGVVAEIGPEVDQFSVGDRVVGTGNGTLAEYAVAPVQRLVSLPAGLDFPVGAITPISGISALQALRRVPGGGAGRRALILGASGGVGSFTVQLAALREFRITAVCSTAKATAVRAWGADEVICHDQVSMIDYVPSQRFDAVIDIAGNLPVPKLRSLLSPTGTLIIVGGDQGTWLGLGRQFQAMVTAPFVKQNLSFLISTENAVDIHTMIDNIHQGAIRAPLDKIFDLAEAPAALQYLADGRAVGKVAVRIRDARS